MGRDCAYQLNLERAGSTAGCVLLILLLDHRESGGLGGSLPTMGLSEGLAAPTPAFSLPLILVCFSLLQLETICHPVAS